MLLSAITAATAKKVLLAQLPKIALVTAIIVIGIYLYEEGYSDAKKKYEKEIKLMQAEELAASIKVINAVRLQEQTIAKESIDVVTKLNEDLQNEILQKASVISSINNGTLKLRDKFTCKTSTPTNKPTTRSDAEAGKGFSKQDEEFFISESSRADQVVDKLNACQSLLVVLKNNYDQACKYE